MMDAAGDAEEHPFGDMAYLVTAALDPTFAYLWVDHDMLMTEERRENVKPKIKCMCKTKN